MNFLRSTILAKILIAVLAVSFLSPSAQADPRLGQLCAGLLADQEALAGGGKDQVKSSAEVSLDPDFNDLMSAELVKARVVGVEQLKGLVSGRGSIDANEGILQLLPVVENMLEQLDLWAQQNSATLAKKKILVDVPVINGERISNREHSFPRKTMTFNIAKAYKAFNKELKAAVSEAGSGNTQKLTSALMHKLALKQSLLYTMSRRGLLYASVDEFGGLSPTVVDNVLPEMIKLAEQKWYKPKVFDSWVQSTLFELSRNGFEPSELPFFRFLVGQANVLGIPTELSMNTLDIVTMSRERIRPLALNTQVRAVHGAKFPPLADFIHDELHLIELQNFVDDPVVLRNMRKLEDKFFEYAWNYETYMENADEFLKVLFIKSIILDDGFYKPKTRSGVFGGFRTRVVALETVEEIFDAVTDLSGALVVRIQDINELGQIPQAMGVNLRDREAVRVWLEDAIRLAREHLL